MDVNIAQPAVSITELLPPEPVDATGKVGVSPDRNRAFINITMPRDGGRSLTVTDIRRLLQEAGVVSGIRENTVESLADMPLYSRDVTIAEGTPPQKGRDGELTYHIRLTRDSTPVQRDDGTLDYRTLGLIENVVKDQKLCTKTMAEDGVDGTNVLGGAIASQRGKDVALPLGKNTYISEDQLTLFAKVSGQCDIRDRKLVVDETYSVKGDVCMSTGNINFVGNVNISGSVLAGFVVKADGNINVSGTVESATLIAGGNIIVNGGFNGGQKGELVAGGMVRCKYIQGGRVTAAGNVESQVLMQSVVQTGDSVRLTGQRSTILGGRVTANNSVECDIIGHHTNPVSTIIEVGSDPALSARRIALQKELVALRKTHDSVGQIVKAFEMFEETRGPLPPDRQEVLMRSRHTLRTNNEQILSLEQENEEIRLKLANEGYGTIIARTGIYPGVQIIIGPEHQLVTDAQTAVMLVRGEEGLYSSAPTRKR
ncbi:hypothetical protein FACS1894217_09850 [Clostridia bacterium]|nr:hypothetical protein FACS1894217_09850 [Clostridia bacterium]